MNRAIEITPVGRGAVAVVLVTGPDAASIVSSLFHAANRLPLSKQAIGRIMFGNWRETGGEEVIVCRRTKERVEVHCHGGGAAAQAICDDLTAAGCELMPWQAWIDDEGDPIRTEARIALAAATTARAAGILLDQYQGALTAAVGRVIALIDGDETKAAAAAIDELLARARLGMHLTRPWQVVIAGRPNVGKSSLLNALMGFGRAIVCDQPGTTRDVVTSVTAMDGWPVQLADTAGLHAAADPVERAGIELARAQLATADLVILVDEATRVDDANIGSESYDQLRCLAEDTPALRVMNKIDLLPGNQVAQSDAHVIRTSATNGDGVAQLVTAIRNALVPIDPPAGTAVPFSERQLQCLSHVETAAQQGRYSDARAALMNIIAKVDARCHSIGTA